jgi:ABC-type multidrug transport system permease subunit
MSHFRLLVEILIAAVNNICRFFKQLLLVFLIQQMAAGVFRLIAGVCRTMIIANTGGALTLLMIFMLGGFILPKG